MTRLISDCATTEDGWRLEVLDSGSRWVVLSYVAKTKSLIRCTVMAQLICAFVLANANSRFSHDDAKIKLVFYLGRVHLWLFPLFTRL